MERKRGLKILRVAVDNVAGFPSDFSKMHNQSGDIARLVTLHRNVFGYPEDICLDLLLPRGSFARSWRQKKQGDLRRRDPQQVHYFQPQNLAEKLYFMFDDRRRKKRVKEAIKQYQLDAFEIIFYDSGLDFYRNSAQAKSWKEAGKKIILCYYGSDLRVRGIIREMEEIADLSITAEFDHLRLKPDLEFIFYPYDASELPEKRGNDDGICRIVHSPTNRQYKGTDTVLEVMEQLRKFRKFDFHLLEKRPRQEVLEIKSRCDIGVDSIGNYLGNTGYGKSGLEMLALGMPVVTSMVDEYRKWLPENPFVVANDARELYDALLEMIDDHALIQSRGEAGRLWVEKYHGFKSVNQRLNELYQKYGII